MEKAHSAQLGAFTQPKASPVPPLLLLSELMKCLEFSLHFLAFCLRASLALTISCKQLMRRSPPDCWQSVTRAL